MSGARNPFGRILMPGRVLPHSVDIYPETDLDDDAGGRIPDANASSTQKNIPCWVQPLSSEEQMEFARADLVLTDRVVFFTDPQVTRGYQFQFGSRRLVVTSIQNELEQGYVWTAMTRDIAAGPI